MINIKLKENILYIDEYYNSELDLDKILDVRTFSFKDINYDKTSYHKYKEISIMNETIKLKNNKIIILKESEYEYIYTDYKISDKTINIINSRYFIDYNGSPSIEIKDTRIINKINIICDACLKLRDFNNKLKEEALEK